MSSEGMRWWDTAGEGSWMNRRKAVLLFILLSLSLAGCIITDEGGYRRGYAGHEDHREYGERGDRGEGEHR